MPTQAERGGGYPASVGEERWQGRIGRVRSVIRQVEECAHQLFRAGLHSHANTTQDWWPSSGDAVVDRLAAAAMSAPPGPWAESIAVALSAQAPFTQLAPSDDLDPFMSMPGRGHRVTLTWLVHGLFSSAAVRAAIEGVNDVETFVELVLENLDELGSAILKGRCVTQAWAGYANIEIPAELNVTTPWGVLRTPPDVEAYPYAGLDLPQPTSAILIWDQETEVRFSRESAPDLPEDTQSERAWFARAYLLPLGFALATSTLGTTVSQP